jgi:integrase
MPERETLGPWLRRFLVEYIVTERNLARNTRSSYRDTFSLLLPFVSRKLRKPIDRLAVRDLISGLVLKFLGHLEEDRGCSVRNRNQRLAAIRAFARFVGSRDPAHVEWCGHIRAIASKKSMPPPIGWLTRTEMEAMLAVPDRKTGRGRREYALLLFLYNTGARASEATQVKVGDLKLARKQRLLRSRRSAWQGRQDTSVPAVAGNRASSGSRNPRPKSRGRRVRQQTRDAAHPLQGLQACRTLCSAGSGTGGKDDNPACDPAYDGLPPGPRRRGH